MREISLGFFLDNPKTCDSALEAIVTPKVVSKTENTSAPMAITLITDDIIKRSKLKPVTDHISFMSGAIPTEGGLFSTQIFGSTPDQRQRQYAYIDLREKFFHPYVYEILKFLMPKRFEKCASGNGAWKIEEGKLVEITDKDDPTYNEDNSGVQWLVQNFKKLKFDKNDSVTRNERVTLLEELTDDEIFISKFIVVPVFFRDVDMRGSVKKLPEINDRYNAIIRYSNSLADSTFSFFNNQIRYNLQQELVAIRKFAQSLLEGKRGFIQKFVVGKSIDRGSRDVISVSSFVGYEKPEDNPVDIFSIGIPLAKALIMGYDFVLRYCQQFFADSFRNVTEYPTFKYNARTNEYEVVGSIKLADQMQRFSSKYIEKRINRFKNSHESRFDPIMILAEDGTEIPMRFTGFIGDLSGGDDPSKIINRPMTWTDLFYMAAYEMLSDKYIYVTRYPVTSHNSVFAARCHVLSTIKTQKMVIEDKEFPYYPVVDISDATRISNLFNDTTTMSTLMLDIIGGDFDGDTVSERMAYSLEANAEAKTISESIKNFISTEGGLMRIIGNESYLTLYNLTRTDPSGRKLDDKSKYELLNYPKDKYTISSISKMFGWTTPRIPIDKRANRGFERIPPKYNPYDTMILNPGEWHDNKESIVTTVGRFLLNRIIFEDTIFGVLPNKFYNEVCDKKKFGKLTDKISKAAMNKELLPIPHLANFLKAYEFWTLTLVTIFSASYSMKTIVPMPELEKEKEKLLTDMTRTDVAHLTEVEDKLVQKASDLLEGDFGKHMFASGARGSFENDFKNMQICLGASQNPITNEYEFNKSCYMSGIAKEDLAKSANIILQAEFPKAEGTRISGYLAKQLYSMLQTIGFDLDPESDCGTKQGLKIYLTKDNLEDYRYQYIQDGNKTILIDDDLPPSYLNRNVIIRSPMYCLSKRTCSRCVGERYYRLDTPNYGLTGSALAGGLVNARMKFRHNMKISVDIIDEDNLFK